jgi:RNA polymerase sigma factor (sigma-70 family)
MSDDSSQPYVKGAAFATTRWSVVLAARGHDSGAAHALSDLCKGYWYPLYAFVRRQGYTPPDAEDLTQEFFARFIAKGWLGDVDRERGRFRSFLLAAVKNFLTNEWKRGQRQKRGGGAEILSLDLDSAEQRYTKEPADIASAERLYDRRWALDLLDRVIARLEAEWSRAGKSAHFAALQFCLTVEKSPLSEIATQLGMTEGAVKVAVHRMRERYRELLHAEIAGTVAEPSQVDSELADLLAVLRG